MADTGGSAERPLFSPDGTRIAFVSTKQGDAGIDVLDLGGGSLRRITNNDRPPTLDAWSADGRYLHFSSGELTVGYQSAIRRVPAAGGTPVDVRGEAYVNQMDGMPSPDGSQLAYVRNGFGQWWRRGHSHIDTSSITIERIATQTFERVTDGAAKDRWPMWSPDGSALYYFSDRSGSDELWLRRDARTMTTTSGKAVPRSEIGWMNRLGVHALVWTGGWAEDEAAHAIAATKRAGYDLIEIPLLDPATVDAAMTRRLLDEHGLEATCSLGLSAATDISSENSAVVAAGEELLHAALDCAVTLRAPFVGGVIYSALQKYVRPPSAAGRANAVRVLKGLARRAAENGVTLGLEVVNRYETNMLNTAAEALAFLAEIDEPAIGVHLDTYHMNIEEDDMALALRSCGDKLVYVHVGESHRGYLGSGSVDWSNFFKALAELRYGGTITFESFSSAVVSPTLSNTLGVWRDLWTDGFDLAVRAKSFVTSQLRES